MWIGAKAALQIYVVKLSDDGDVAKAALHHTVTDVQSTRMVYVNDYLEQPAAGAQGPPGADGEDAAATPAASQSLSERALAAYEDASAVSIAALVLSVVACVLGGIAICVGACKKNTGPVTMTSPGPKV